MPKSPKLFLYLLYHVLEGSSELLWPLRQKLVSLSNGTTGGRLTQPDLFGEFHTE